MKLLVPTSFSSSPSSFMCLRRPPTVTSFGLPSLSSCSRPTSTLHMRIIPCSKAQMQELVPRKVTTEQWQAYWGVNKMERLQKVLESILLAYGGAWIAWFLSLVSASVGAVLSSFAGTALVFNWMYAPYLYARKRNAKLWTTSRGGQRLHYALYVGRIVGLKRIRRRAGKTVGAVAQEYLVLTVEDEERRQLEIITQWQDSYRRLRPQMRCENLIVSSREDFSILAMVTESWIPAAGVWVGDYPYLQRPKFRSFVDNTLLLVDGEETEGNGVVSVSAMGRRSSGNKKDGTSCSGAGSSSSSSSAGGSGSSVSASRLSDMNTSMVVDRLIPPRQASNRVMERTTTPLQPLQRFNTKESRSTRARARAGTNRRQGERMVVGEGIEDSNIDRKENVDEDRYLMDEDDPLQDIQAWLDVIDANSNSDGLNGIVDMPEWSTSVDTLVIATTTTTSFPVDGQDNNDDINNNDGKVL